MRCGISCERCKVMRLQPLARLKIGAAFFTPATVLPSSVAEATATVDPKTGGISAVTVTIALLAVYIVLGVITFFSWAGISRVVRGQTLRIVPPRVGTSAAVTDASPRKVAPSNPAAPRPRAKPFRSPRSSPALRRPRITVSGRAGCLRAGRAGAAGECWRP